VTVSQQFKWERTDRSCDRTQENISNL